MLRPKIAVLDDDPDAAQATARALNIKGLAAECFTDAQSLMISAARTNYGAFVLDWLLNEGTADPVVRWIRAQEHLGVAPIYILSGNLSLGDEPVDPGITGVIREFALHFRPKPTSVMQLARDIFMHLGGEK